MALRATLFATLVVLAASAPDRFTSGPWEGKANFDEEGQFSDCTMTQAPGAATELGLVITTGSDIGLLVADRSLHLEVGTRKAIILLMDGQEPIPAIGRAVHSFGFLVPLQSSKALLKAIRSAKTLRVSMSEKELSFTLIETDAAIEALIDCVKSHQGTSRVEL